MLKLIQHTYHGFKFSTILGDDAPIEILDSVLEFLDTINIKGKNVIDGGSNIGLYSLEFSRRVGSKGKVYAFELQKTISEVSNDNFVANCVTNIVSYNAALSCRSYEWVGFTAIDYYGEKMSSGGIRTEPSLGFSDGENSTKTIAVDDMGIENVGLIKLDIEGYEPSALDGMWSTIDKYKPYLIIELSDGYLGEEAVERTIQKIKSHGYTCTNDVNFNYFFIPII